MTNEHHIANLKSPADIKDVLGIPFQAPVPGLAVGVEIGLAPAHVVEQDNAVIVLEGRGDESPHVLVAAEPVGKEHGPTATAEDSDLIAAQDVGRHLGP